jgi:hypothetical protein
MNPNLREAQFLAFYERYRYEDQRTFYRSRIDEFESAHSQAIILTSVFMGCAGVASVLAALDAAQLRMWWALLAVIFPVVATAFAAYDRLYAFEQQTKLYHDAFRALPQAHKHLPFWKEGMSERDFQEAINAYVEEVEAILRSERGQWGQLISQVRPVNLAGGNTEQRGKTD